MPLNGDNFAATVKNKIILLFRVNQPELKVNQNKQNPKIICESQV